MIQGSCLCGGVKFQIEKILGPFELCHCHRCRKVSGSAFLAAVVVSREGFRFLQGQELVKTYEAPVRHTPPGYRSIFCGVCGSRVPDPNDSSPQFEIAAGALDGDPGLVPDKHIFIEDKSPWFAISDRLPRMTEEELNRYRANICQSAG